MTAQDVEPLLPQFDGVFLGGSDTFKAQAWRWRVFARDHGKPFHYARAGSLPRLESALKMKADSLDWPARSGRRRSSGASARCTSTGAITLGRNCSPEKPLPETY